MRSTASTESRHKRCARTENLFVWLKSNDGLRMLARPLGSANLFSCLGEIEMCGTRAGG